uniref:LCP family protein n=1 Tax=Streptomyces polyasparticus TaxID=2767826 RepID=UPI00280B5D4E|nr:LCP family protein [Streptomyces polyasparticus]
MFPTDVPAEAQPEPGKGGQNFLLAGVDSRSSLPTTGEQATGDLWKPGAQRSDTMMLVHLPADHSAAYFVSLPRDSWVYIPGHGKAKLNAAFSWGGPPLLIDTVQRLTNLKVDHFAVLDWDGFKKLTNELGGVDIPLADGEKRHMNGEEALGYVRERYSLARGDLDRTHRQQNFLRAVFAKTLSKATLSDPFAAKALLDKVTASVSVDDQLSNSDLRDLAWAHRNLRVHDMEFMNAPTSGTGTVQGQSVVNLDRSAGERLWQAIRDDDMAAYLAENETDSLTVSPR